MPVRPSEAVLSAFYSMADPSDEARRKAVLTLVSNETIKNDEIQTYVIERLIGGLGSPRAAARVGFSTALAHLLTLVKDEWTIEKLLQVADRKISLTDKDMEANHAIGHHLLCTAIIASGAFSDVSSVIKHELSLYDRFAWLGMTVLDTVAKKALTDTSKQFGASELWEIIKKRLPSDLNEYRPEHLYLVLQLSKKFAGVVHEKVPFVTKKHGVSFNDEQLNAVLGILKKCDQSNQLPVISALITVARDSGHFSKVYRGTIEKWSLGGDVSKATERLFQFSQFALQNSENSNEILAVLSPEMMERITTLCTGHVTPEKKVLRNQLKPLFELITEKLSNETDGKILLAVLVLFDSVGHLDQIVKGRYTEKLLEKLSGDELEQFLKNAQTAHAWSLRRIASVFGSWDAETRENALLALSASGFEKTEDRHNTIAGCVDHMFNVKVRPGEHANVFLSEADEVVLRKVVEGVIGKDQVKKAFKSLKSCALEHLVRPLTVMWMCVQLWTATTPDVEEAKGYKENVEEILEISSKLGKDKESKKVLIDLLTALLGQPRRYHRSLVYFVFVNTLPNATFDEINHILDTIGLTDDQLAGTADEENMSDEDADMDIDEDVEESDDEQEKEESDSEQSADSDLDSMGEVNPVMVDRLQKALGKAAAKDKDTDKEDSEESSDEGVDDETMFKLDAGLAAAFKAMAGKSANKTRNAANFAQPLRAKLIDLLLFALSSPVTNPVVKLRLAVPLLALAKTLLKRGGDETATKKVIELLEVVPHTKKLDVPEKAIRKELEALTEEASAITNPTLKTVVTHLAGWLLGIGVRGESGASDTLKNAFMDLFDNFMKQEEGKIGTELATAAIVKYPHVFSSEFSKLVAYGFNEECRIFRRTESLLCAVSILRKDVAKEHPIDKKAVKDLGEKAATVLKTLKDDEEPKARFIAAVLKLLAAAATGGIESKYKNVLWTPLQQVIVSLADDKELWKQGGKMKKVSSSCQQVAGKPALSLLKSIHAEMSS